MQIETWLANLERWIWGPPLLILLCSVGLYLTFVLRGLQFRRLIYSMRLAFTRQSDTAEGDISQFQALMTALAGMIGIGSITGVATAVALGGLGSVFWMWVASLLGMATKYAEAVLAVKYRSLDSKKQMCGGPMYYLEKGLKSKKLALFFAVMGACTALGTGNMVQANSISEAIREWLQIDPLFVGIFLALCTAATLFGGIKSIGKVSSFLVPAMALLYVGAGIWVICLRIDALPSAFSAIFQGAFTKQAAFGGFAGSTIMTAIQYGVSRSVFSTEAGLGSSPIAAAAAKTDLPGRQALISMSGVFLTSMVVCTITALCISVSGLLGQTDSNGSMLNGSSLALQAFQTAIPGGALILTVSLILFGYSTILSWAYYGEKCVEYLLGSRTIHLYRVLFILVLIPGAVMNLQTVWSFSNIMNGLMAFPNLIGLLGLSSIVVREMRLFEEQLQLEGKRDAKVVDSV